MNVVKELISAAKRGNQSYTKTASAAPQHYTLADLITNAKLASFNGNWDKQAKAQGFKLMWKGLKGMKNNAVRAGTGAYQGIKNSGSVGKLTTLAKQRPKATAAIAGLGATGGYTLGKATNNNGYGPTSMMGGRSNGPRNFYFN